jgi:hypothetical protein
LLGDRKPAPTPGRRRRRDTRQAQRRQIRASEAQDGRSERPATGYEEPEAGANPNGANVKREGTGSHEPD